MRTQYVLIDYENLQPESLKQLNQDCFRVKVFVGANQTKLPVEFVMSLQALGPRAEYIVMEGNGPNALDFHIAYYVGQLVATDPQAYFHIVSKDTGFDPLIRHLKKQKVFARRVQTVGEIGMVSTQAAVTTEDRVKVILTRLRQMKEAKPGTRKTLQSTIAHLFQQQLPDEAIVALTDGLVKVGVLSFNNEKAVYNLPENGQLKSSSSSESEISTTHVASCPPA